jgi:MSHA biogenesis protein MshJ
MSYLEKIESMPWDLYWENVQLDVEKYPQARIVITVFTLSLKKGWVGV